jgi:hypothetical protein
LKAAELTGVDTKRTVEMMQRRAECAVSALPYGTAKR